MIVASNSKWILISSWSWAGLAIWARTGMISLIECVSVICGALFGKVPDQCHVSSVLNMLQYVVCTIYATKSVYIPIIQVH